VDAVTFPIHRSERELDEQRYRNDPLMLEILRHAWAVQDSLDADIRAWRTPATATVTETVAWLQAGRKVTVTPYNYRRHARAESARLLFKICDFVPHQMASRTINEDKWSEDEARDYWRCVAICSAAWVEAAE